MNDSPHCTNCGKSIPVDANFCIHCNAPVSPPSMAPPQGGSQKIMAGGDLTQNTTVTNSQAPFSTPSMAPPQGGSQKIMAGGDLTQNTTVTNTNTTTVFNQDETKQIKTCAVTGKTFVIADGYECQSCNNWTHKDGWDLTLNICRNCSDAKSQSVDEQFRAEVLKALEDDVLEPEEIVELREIAQKLGISDDDARKVIGDEQQKRLHSAGAPLMKRERMVLDDVKSIHLDRYYVSPDPLGGGEAESCLSELEAVYQRHPNNLEVARTLVLAYASHWDAPGDPIRVGTNWVDKITDFFKTEPAFQYDSPEKSLYMVACSNLLVLGGDIARMVDEGQNEEAKKDPLFEGMRLDPQQRQALKSLSIEGGSTLERIHAETPEFVIVDLAYDLERFYRNGRPEREKEQLLQVLDENSHLDGDVGKALHFLRGLIESNLPCGLVSEDSQGGQNLGGVAQKLYLSLLANPSDVRAEIASSLVPSRPLKTIDADIAQEFLANCESINLDDFEKITDAAAELLSRHKGEVLLLKGLRSLTDAAAESLSRFEGEFLTLDGLSSLTAAAAESLSKYKGDLTLGGLTSLTDAAVESLSRYKGKGDRLWLKGLRSLTDAAAESLSRFEGNAILLESLRSLTDAAAESLSRYKGEVLFLEGLTSLTDAAAESLSRFKGQLYLNGLSSLTDAAAESLSRAEGQLHLNGLSSLTDAAAESLSRHEGGLTLGGLSSLTDAAAESLSKYKGDLTLGGLTSLTDAAVESLLSRNEKEFPYLMSMTSLTDAAAESLSRFEGNAILLESLRSLTDAAAESLSRYKGYLDLGGLSSLTDAAAESLSRHDGDLDLGGLSSLTDAAAESLSRHDGDLNLFGLRSLTDAAAESLSRHKGELSFNDENDELYAAVERFRARKEEMAREPAPAEHQPKKSHWEQALEAKDRIKEAAKGVMNAHGEIVLDSVAKPLKSALGIEEADANAVVSVGGSADPKQAYVDALELAAVNEKMFYGPGIPEKKLKGAVKGFLPGTASTVFLYDDTLFGGCKEGLAITADHHVYFKEIMEKGVDIPLKSVMKVSGGGLLSSAVVFELANGSKVKFKPTIESSNNSKVLVSVVSAALEYQRHKEGA